MNRKTLSRYWALIFVAVMLILAIFPIIWVFYLSIIDNATETLGNKDTTVKFTLSNYIELWHNSFFKKTFINSIGITALSTVLSLSIAFPCAYYLTIISRKREKMKNIKLLLFDIWLLLTYMLPEFLFIIPMYILYQKLGLYDTYLGLALMYQVHVLPFSIWMIKNFFQNDIPHAIGEAASIDGASHKMILFRIYIPIAKSGVVAMCILNAIWIWNELAIALGLSFSNAQTITVGVTAFRGYTSINYGAMTAASIVAIVPMLVAAIFVQKHILRGLAAGAVK